MERPIFTGHLEGYIEEMCKYADSLREEKRDTTTVSLEINLVLFGPAGKVPTLASIADRPISIDPLVNMGVYRAVLERKLANANDDRARKQERIDELEALFHEELRVLEEKKWEQYNQELL